MRSFLLSKKANLATTELFNDTWASASLNCAATAETHCYLAEQVEEGTLEADAQAVKAAGHQFSHPCWMVECLRPSQPANILDGSLSSLFMSMFDSASNG